MSEDLQQRIHDAIANPKNLGEMENADSVGTVGSPDCGDMLRMWVKFKEQDGKKVIDRATFQTFGCETAIAVASVATELIAGQNRGRGAVHVRRRSFRAARAAAADEDPLRAARGRRAALRARAAAATTPAPARNPPPERPPFSTNSMPPPPASAR